MTLRDRIPVEPLSDERVTNIERSVVVGASDAVQRPGLRDLTRPRWMSFAAAAAVALVVGVVGWRVGASATSTSTSDIAVVEPIRVDTRERTTLDIGDARITHEPNTQVVITRPAGGVLLEITRGKVELEVGKRGTRPALVVRAGDTDVVVVGTRFAVDYGNGTQAPIVTVTEGIVEVVHAKKSTGRIAANQAWTLSRGVVALSELDTSGTSGTSGTIASNAGATPASSTDVDENGTIPPGPSTTPSTTSPTATDLALRDRPGSTPTGSAETTNRPPPGSVADPGSGAGERGTKKKVVVQYTQNLHKALRAQPVTPAHDIGIDNPKEAIKQHYVAAAKRGDEAARALYSIAVLQLLELRDPAKALATLDAYFSRFRHKSEHADALWLRVRILCERRFDDACHNAARNYASEVPAGAKSGMANEITAVHE